MNTFVSKLIASLAAIVIFIIVWIPVGMLMVLAGGYIPILGLAWVVVCFLAAKAGYKWVLDKLLKQSSKEDVLHVEEVPFSEENNEEVVDSKEIK